MSSYTLEPLGPTFGARILGLDTALPADATTRAALVEDLRRHRVLVFPEQDLDHARHIEFSRNFGPLDVYPVSDYVVREHPEVLVISNIFENGRPIGLYDGDEQEEWHTDYSWKTRLSRASLLYSAVAPDVGRDTLFADATGAYDDLPSDVRTTIDDLVAVHSMNHLVEQERLVNPHKAPLTDREREQMPDVCHPLVRTHPDTGRRSLLLGSMIISEIIGLADREGRELLDRLHEHVTSERYVYRHHWAVGDLVLWDNQATMHTRTACDRHQHQRLLYRTTVM